MFTQFFCEKPKPENRRAGFVQHVQSPFGIFCQPVDDVLGQIGAHAERDFSRGVTVAKDVFDGGDFGRIALLHLENESRHGVSV
jgi:hypothetical protein